MKRISNKRILAIMTIFVLLQGIFFPAFFAEAKDTKEKGTKENADFKVEMEYGIDGFAVYVLFSARYLPLVLPAGFL